MKIIILGANGMLGHDMVKAFNDTDLYACDKDTVDITDSSAVQNLLKEKKPDIVINCAAYTNVDDAESEEELCRSINVDGVKNIAAVCKQINCALVHISSDYIFDGEKTEGYAETDMPNPRGVYAKSKADAEPFVLSLDKFFLVRSAWLYGKHGRNFVDTIKRLTKEKDELRIVNDQVGNPTYTKDLAQAVRSIVSMPYGIYHATNSGDCTWYEFAQAIVKELGLSIPIHPITTAEYPVPAPRPKVSILLNSKLPPLRHWSDALHDYMT